MRICPQCSTQFREALQYCPHDGSQTYEAADSGARPRDPLLGVVVDERYRVEEKIGEGGMGVVYLASHAVLQKKLALKVLRGDGSRDPDVVQRFMQEAQAATSIGHANIVDITDFGRLSDGSVYFVMEFLDGISLTDLIKRGGAVRVEEAIHLVRQIGSALEAAHARGIVHRDLKPDNIFVIRQGKDARFVKVLDFGVAKVGGAASKLTKTGMVFGTPHYMSPEQAAGQSVDQRTDVYALGVIMYEMFSGKVPFDADTFMGILSKHMFDAPPRPTDAMGASIGPLEAVILRALEKNPDRRYQSMTELLADVETVAEGGSVRALPAPLRGAAAPEVPPEVEPVAAPGKRVALLVVALAALALLGLLVGAAAFMLSGGDESEAVALMPSGDARAEPTLARTQPAAHLAEEHVTEEGVAEEGVAAPAPVAAPLPEEPAEEPPALSITSEPPGAEVHLDGVMVGNTPISLPRPSSGTQSVALRLRGHEETEIQISSESSESLRVTLEREHRGRRAPRVPRARATSATPATPELEAPAAPPRRTSEVVDPWAY